MADVLAGDAAVDPLGGRVRGRAHDRGSARGHWRGCGRFRDRRRLHATPPTARSAARADTRRRPGHRRVRRRDRAGGDVAYRVACDDAAGTEEGSVRIEVHAVSKKFDEFEALSSVTLDVPEGSLMALLGPSGSGKSTLLRIIAGLEQPDSGHVLMDGADVTAARPQDRGIGVVFQHYAAFAHMTVRENVAFGLRIRKRPKADVKQRVDELLALVGLTKWSEQHPHQLSGGQRQRMALARALAIDPRVLLLGEAFGG